MTDKLVPPFNIHSNESTFWLSDQNGTRFSFTYFRAVPLIGTGDDKPSRETARKYTAYLARLPEGVLVGLKPEVRQALARFIESRPEELTEAQAVAVMVEDVLIGLGDLPLGGGDRGKVAGGKRG